MGINEKKKEKGRETEHSVSLKMKRILSIDRDSQTLHLLMSSVLAFLLHLRSHLQILIFIIKQVLVK